MAALPPQSGIARELETESERGERERKGDEVEVRIFLSPLSFLFLFFSVHTVHDFYYVLYSLLLAWPFYYYIFVAFVLRLSIFTPSGNV